MAFLHSHSDACLKTELNIFDLPPTQTAIDSSIFMNYNPVSALSDNAPIEFFIPASDDYLDLAHTLLSVRMQITPNHAADNAKVAPVNNLLHSLFNQIDVFFNHKIVSQSNNSYAYRAYIETLLNYSEEAKLSHLTTSLWVKDTPAFMDNAPNDGNNEGIKKRQEFTLAAKTIDLVGHLHCDVFNQDRFLINGVDLRLRLIRSSNEFVLFDNSADGKFSINLTEASLIIRRVKISPGVLLAHASTLAKSTAKYPITRVEVKTFTLHTGVNGETIDNVILGVLPKRIIIGFVENKAFNGDRKKNPFNFQHFDLNYLSLHVDGIQIPTKPLQPNFTGANATYVDSYLTLFTGGGIHFLNEGNGIDRVAYSKGYSLFAFDLTPDLSANFTSHWNLVKHGTVRLEVRFAKALTVTVNCVVYAEYDNLIEIDASRQVVADFNS